MKHIPVVESARIQQIPFSVVNHDGAAPVLIICDHASRHVPPEYGDLGLPAHQLAQHIAWDIGASQVSRRLAELLDAPAVLCGTSRLVIDCNRLWSDPSSIPTVSDGIHIPGNANVDEAERQRRIDRYFQPYHLEIENRIRKHPRQEGLPALISIHSFTPVMAGFQRPWHVGVLWDQDRRLADPVIQELRRNQELVVGENEPYTGTSPKGYALHTHAADNRLPIAVFEIRQDLIETQEGTDRWAYILASALAPVLKAYANGS